jgi:hypothetical protein
MGVPTSEVGYTSATTGRGDHEVYKGHVVALGENRFYHRYHLYNTIIECFYSFIRFELLEIQ